MEAFNDWGTVCQVVRDLWLLVGPRLRGRPENWPRVRLLAPEPGLVEVVPVMETNIHAAPFDSKTFEVARDLCHLSGLQQI
eukprot:6104268-Amphidinium_carterae.6